MGFVIGYMIYSNVNVYCICITYIAAVITDYLDGWFARKYNVHDTKWGIVSGRWLDKICDRIIMICIYSTLIVKNWGFAINIIYLSLLNAYEIIRVVRYQCISYTIPTKPNLILGRSLNQILYFVQCILMLMYISCYTQSTYCSINFGFMFLYANVLCAFIHMKYCLI
jgi:phosphatidylglycerophosphate synthase